MELCHFEDVDDVIPMQPQVQRPLLKIRSYWVKNERSYERTNQTIKKSNHWHCNWPKMSRWPSGSHDILHNCKVSWISLISLTKSRLNSLKNKRDICNCKLNDVMYVRPEVTWKSELYEKKSSSFFLYQHKSEINPTVNNREIPN